MGGFAECWENLNVLHFCYCSMGNNHFIENYFIKNHFIKNHFIEYHFVESHKDDWKVSVVDHFVKFWSYTFGIIYKPQGRAEGDLRTNYPEVSYKIRLCFKYTFSTEKSALVIRSNNFDKLNFFGYFWQSVIRRYYILSVQYVT